MAKVQKASPPVAPAGQPAPAPPVAGPLQPLLRLERVRLREFRAVTDAVLELGDSTVLIGENNVGKTAVLEGLNIAIGEGFASTTDLRVDAGGVTAARFIIDLELRPWTGGQLAAEVTDLFGAVYHPEPGTGVQRYFVRVVGDPDPSHRSMKVRRSFVADWDAPLDQHGDEVTPEQRRQLWFSLLDARRDLVDDLRRRSSPWGKMLRRLELDPIKRKQFETQLATLSANVTNALPDAGKLATAIGRLSSAFAGQVASAELSLIPKALEDLWRTADLVVQASGHAKLSIAQQGMGARSLSSLLAFRAFLEAELAASVTDSEQPFLVVTGFEEPEAHLHPQAQRAAFGEIAGLPGQRIVSTHSPQIVASADVEDYRVVRRGTSVTIRSAKGIGKKPGIEADALENCRRFCIRRNADMIFARTVILCEGDTEYPLLSALGRVWWNSAPEQRGISVVGLDGAGKALTFASFLTRLDVPWVLLLDGDQAGIDAQHAIAADSELSPHVSTDVFLLNHGGAQCDLENFIVQTAKTAVARALAQSPQHEAALLSKPHAELVDKLKSLKGSQSSKLADAVASEWNQRAKMPQVLQDAFKRVDTLKG